MVRVRVAALSLLVSALRVTAVHLLPHLQPQLQLQLHTHHRDTGAGALGVSEGLGQSSQCTLMDLQCNRGGHLVLTLDRGEGESEEGERRRSWHLEQYSLQNEFQSRGGCWLTPLISKLVVPPDTFLTGDQLLLHKDTSNTPGGHLPLVLLLHATSQVFQTGGITVLHTHYFLQNVTYVSWCGWLCPVRVLIVRSCALSCSVLLYLSPCLPSSGTTHTLAHTHTTHTQRSNSRGGGREQGQGQGLGQEATPLPLAPAAAVGSLSSPL